MLDMLEMTRESIEILLGAFEYDFEVEEGFILNVGTILRQRRGISKAEEGVIWAISERTDS